MGVRAHSSFKSVDFAVFEQRLVPRIIAAVTSASDAVKAQAQENAPYGTGELHDSAQREVAWIGKAVTGHVAFTAGHAAFVEFGTGTRGRGTYPYDLPRSGTPYTGSWVYDYKRQNWRGMTARPYLRPALDESRGAILHAYEEQGFKV